MKKIFYIRYLIPVFGIIKLSKEPNSWFSWRSRFFAAVLGIGVQSVQPYWQKFEFWCLVHASVLVHNNIIPVLGVMSHAQLSILSFTNGFDLLKQVSTSKMSYCSELGLFAKVVCPVVYQRKLHSVVGFAACPKFQKLFPSQTAV